MIAIVAFTGAARRTRAVNASAHLVELRQAKPSSSDQWLIAQCCSCPSVPAMALPCLLLPPALALNQVLPHGLRSAMCRCARCVLGACEAMHHAGSACRRRDEGSRVLGATRSRLGPHRVMHESTGTQHSQPFHGAGTRCNPPAIPHTPSSAGPEWAPCSRPCTVVGAHMRSQVWAGT